jgi:hypothetical protein
MHDDEVLKLCSDCKKLKKLSLFNRCSGFKDGRQYRCKECVSVHNKQRMDTIIARKRQWIQQNKEANHQYQYAYHSQYAKNNRGKCNAYLAKYRATKLQATPSWLTKEQLTEIEDIYNLAKELQWLSEEPLEVDHIIPLQGKNVSGLHVPWNLQILPKSLNTHKGNRV